MEPRYRIRFAGMPSARLVRWLQQLIPVLREAPREIQIDVEITVKADADADLGARRDETG